MLRRGTDMIGKNEAVLRPSKHFACVVDPDLTDVLARAIPLAHPGEGPKCSGELLSIAKRQNPLEGLRVQSWFFLPRVTIYLRLCGGIRRFHIT